MQTLLYFEVVRVKLLFLPSMAKGASVLLLASIFIGCDELLCVPILAHLF